MIHNSLPIKCSLFLFVALQILSITGMCMQPRNYGDIERARESAKFDDSRELHLHQTLGKIPGQSNRPLGVFHRKSDKVVGYADGIIELTLDAAKAPAASALVFSRYSQLKNKPNALLILKLKGTFKGLSFTLPIMDTVIEGDDFPGSKFILHGDTYLNKQLYFIDAQKNNVMIKVSGQSSNSHFNGTVFAMTPAKFVLMQDSLPLVVEQLKVAPGPSPVFVAPLPPILSYPIISSQHFATLSRQQQVLPSVPQIPISLAPPPLPPPISQKIRDIEISQEDEKPKPHRELWPHQKEQIRQISVARKNGFKYSTIFSATGTGKSTTMHHFIKTLDKSTVVLLLTSRKNLITQLAQDFASDGHLKVASSDATNAKVRDFIRNAVTQKDTQRQNVIITTLQGFQRLVLDSELLQGIHMIIYDEAHNLLSEKRTDMVNKLKAIPDLEMLFFTATPTRLNTKTGATYSVYQLSEEDEKESHVKPFTINDAIEAGVNAPFQLVHVKGAQLDLKLEKSNSEYKVDETAKQINIPKYHQIVFDIYMNAMRSFQGGGKPLAGEYAMAFCSNIDHAESLAAYLNEQKAIIPEHKTSYENSIRSFVMGFEGKEGPPELKAIWKATYPSKLSYSKQFFSSNDLKKLAEDFLKAFPYVFADAVHSGNDAVKYSDTVIDAKLLRNKHGGSTFICGADKLTEGFDNQKISVGVMLAPVRKSNTLATQRFGRLVRINPNDKTKVAIAIEFLWDKDQLLLSSTDLLGCMYAGPQGASTFEIPQHVSDVAEYFLSTKLVLKGTAPKSDRKLKKASAKPEVTAKRKRPETSILTQKDVLLDRLIDILNRLEKFCRDLEQYTLLLDPHEELMEVVGSGASQYPHRDPAPIEIVDELYSDKVAQRANDAIKRVKNFFNEANPSKKPRIAHTLEGDQSPNSNTLPAKNNDSNRKLYKKIKRGINKAQSFMSQCQFHNKTQNYSDMLNEIIVTANALAQETLEDTPEQEPIARIEPLPMPSPAAPPRFPVIVDLTDETDEPYRAPQMVYAPCDTAQKVTPVRDAFKKTLEDIGMLKTAPLVLASNLRVDNYAYIISFFENNPHLAARVTAIEIRVPQFPSIQEQLIKLLRPLTQLQTLKLDYSNVYTPSEKAKTSLVVQISMLANLRSFTCNEMYKSEIEAIAEKIPGYGRERAIFPALEELKLHPLSNAEAFDATKSLMHSKGWSCEGGLIFTKVKKGISPSKASPLVHYPVNDPFGYAPNPYTSSVFAPGAYAAWVPQLKWQNIYTTREVRAEDLPHLVAEQAGNLFKAYINNIVTLGGYARQVMFDPQIEFARAAELIKPINFQNTNEIEVDLRRAFFKQAAEYLWHDEFNNPVYYFNLLINLIYFAKILPETFELINSITKVIDRDREGKYKNGEFDSHWAMVFSIMGYRHRDM